MNIYALRSGITFLLCPFFVVLAMWTRTSSTKYFSKSTKWYKNNNQMFEVNHVPGVHSIEYLFSWYVFTLMGLCNVHFNEVAFFPSFSFHHFCNGKRHIFFHPIHKPFDVRVFFFVRPFGRLHFKWKCMNNAIFKCLHPLFHSWFNEFYVFIIYFCFSL